MAETEGLDEKEEGIKEMSRRPTRRRGAMALDLRGGNGGSVDLDFPMLNVLNFANPTKILGSNLFGVE